MGSKELNTPLLSESITRAEVENLENNCEPEEGASGTDGAIVKEIPKCETGSNKEIDKCAEDCQSIGWKTGKKKKLFC